jgi:hypothetical protein
MREKDKFSNPITRENENKNLISDKALHERSDKIA